MARVSCLILSGAFHAGVAGTMILLGTGGHCRLPAVPVSLPPSRPLAVDVVDRTVECEFVRPDFPPSLPFPEEAPLEFKPDREEARPVDPGRPLPPPLRPAPSFERPLPASAAVVRLVPPPLAASAVEVETSAVEIYNPPPDYPRQARRRGLEGEALVEVTILSNGRCGEARLLECIGSSLFGNAALAAVREWKYRPALRGGQAVASTQSIRFLFRLRV